MAAPKLRPRPPRDYFTRHRSRRFRCCALLPAFFDPPFFLSFFFSAFEKSLEKIFRSFRARKEIREISLEKREDITRTKMKNERWRGVRGISKKIWKRFFFFSLRILSRKWNVRRVARVLDWSFLGKNLEYVL